MSGDALSDRREKERKDPPDPSPSKYKRFIRARGQ
jgi:hypothetical protein